MVRERSEEEGNVCTLLDGWHTHTHTPESVSRGGRDPHPSAGDEQRMGRQPAREITAISVRTVGHYALHGCGRRC